MLQVAKAVLLLTFVVLGSASYSLSMFWCGFHWSFCGQSKTDDVNSKANFIMLAFANIQPDGSVLVDDTNFPTSLVSNWQYYNKKVLISVGGASGNWSAAFASKQSRSLFVSTLSSAVKRYNLDGVDLDIQYYNVTPRVVSDTIISLKKSLGKKLLIVSPQCVTVYQGTGVPGLDTTNHPFNFFVPIINMADAYIDYYQIQAYNNWYDYYAPGSTDYLIDVYLNWRNFPGLAGTRPLNNFKGVSGKKILMGVLGSQSAGGPGFYTTPSKIQKFKQYLVANGYPIKGFMIWDSYWDSLNQYTISNAVKKSASSYA